MKKCLFAILMLAGLGAQALEIQNAGIGVNGNLYLTVAHDAGCRQRSLDLKNIVCSEDGKKCQAELDTSKFVEGCTGRISATETDEISMSKANLYGPEFTGTKLTVTYGKNMLGFDKKFTVTLIGERAGYE